MSLNRHQRCTVRIHRFIQAGVLLALLVATKGLEAQGTGHAFSFGTVSQSELVRATRGCLRGVLRVSCEDQLAEANRVIGAKIPGTSFRNRRELADYLASLEQKPCPVGEEAILSRVLGTRVLANDAWRRPFRAGELCLYDNNAGVFILSLSCANFIKSSHSVASAMQPAPVSAMIPRPVGVYTPPRTDPLPLPRQVVIQKRTYWPAILGTVVIGGVVSAFVFRSKSKATSTSTSTSTSQ